MKLLPALLLWIVAPLVSASEPWTAVNALLLPGDNRCEAVLDGRPANGIATAYLPSVKTHEITAAVFPGVLRTDLP